MEHYKNIKQHATPIDDKDLTNKKYVDDTMKEHNDNTNVHVNPTEKDTWNEVISKVDKTQILSKMSESVSDEKILSEKAIADIIASLVTVQPVGSVIPFAGVNAPTGYLVCDGSAISREDYAELFYVIGTTYGAGDGSTTFNLPNLKDKFYFFY